MVTTSELGAFVQPNVYQASGQKQLPQYGRLEGEREVVFLVGDAPKIKEIKERIEALERESSQLELGRKNLEGKRKLLLTHIMELDVQLRQNKEKRELLEREPERLRFQLGAQGALLPQSSRPFSGEEKGDSKPLQEMRPQGGSSGTWGTGQFWTPRQASFGKKLAP